MVKSQKSKLRAAWGRVARPLISLLAVWVGLCVAPLFLAPSTQHPIPSTQHLTSLFVPRPLLAAQYVAKAFTPTASSGPGVTLIGSGTTSQGTSLTISGLTAGAAVGSAVLFCASTANYSSSMSFGLTDSSSNTYTTTNIEANSGSDYNNLCGYTQVSTALTTSSTLTFTPSSSSTWQYAVLNVTGLVGSSPFDISAHGATSYTSTPATSSETPSTQPEMVIVMFGTEKNWSAWGNIIGTAATGLYSSTRASGQCSLDVEYRHITATTAGTGTETIAASDDVSWIFISIKTTS